MLHRRNLWFASMVSVVIWEHVQHARTSLRDPIAQSVCRFILVPPEATRPSPAFPSRVRCICRAFYMRLATCAVILLVAASLLPTLLVDIPAMADYLNHLARMYVLTDAGTPNENPYYEISFALYPNLAMDLIVPQLAKFLEVERATRFFFLGSQVLIVIGAITLEWTIKRRHEMAGFAALLALPSTPFSFGFTNFEFGLGVALFGIASWIACEHRRWDVRVAIHALFVCALFVAHLFALGVYGLVLGLYELRRMCVGRFNATRAAATV